MREDIEFDIEIYVSDDKVEDDILIKEKIENHYDCIVIEINRQSAEEKIVKNNQVKDMLINCTS